MFNKILLAVDGSEHSMRAAQKAAELARSTNPSELRVVVAYENIPLYLGEPNMQYAITHLKGAAEQIMKMSIDEIGKVPCAIQSEIMQGDPASTIIEVANVRKSDLIVMGSRGLGKLSGLLLGSTSQKVVAHAPCPVLIVR